MTFPRDIALAEGSDGNVVVHRADCPDVRAQADRGDPVATLLGIQEMPDDIERHTCLKEKETPVDADAGRWVDGQYVPPSYLPPS